MSDELSAFIEPTVEVEQTETQDAHENADTELEAQKESATAEPELVNGEPTSPDKKESGHVPIAALLDEREKRQAAIKELEELRSQLGKQEQKQAPDVFEDPEGFTKHFESQFNEREWNLRCELTAETMRDRYEDYDDMEKKFLELGEQNPELAVKLRQSPNPAKFAYETAKRAIRLDQLENVDEWEAKKTAELEAKIRAEFEAKQSADTSKSESLSPSLTNTRATGGNTQVISIPDPLESTFNR